MLHGVDQSLEKKVPVVVVLLQLPKLLLRVKLYKHALSRAFVH